MFYVYVKNTSKKKKKSAKQIQAELEHKKFLYAFSVNAACRAPTSCGKGSSPLGRAKSLVGISREAERLALNQETRGQYLHSQPSKPLSAMATPCLKRDIFDATISESEKVKTEIRRKANRTAPLWNKGGYMYVGDKEDLTTIGKKI
jgi:hypothetical protein